MCFKNSLKLFTVAAAALCASAFYLPTADAAETVNLDATSPPSNAAHLTVDKNGLSTSHPNVMGIDLKSYDYKKIAMSDGIEIEISVSVPDKPGNYPLIIMPSPWGYRFYVYGIPAMQWSADGYVVVAYTYRGFAGSGGLADFAGPRSVDDLSEIIDWALANTPSDPTRIGAGGMSYGAVLPMLAAAVDDRIDAVFSLSGVTDVEHCVFPNQTASIDALKLTQYEAGETIIPEMKRFFEQLNTGSINIDEVRKITSSNSPMFELDGLHKNMPAIFQTMSWNDAFCIPQQHIDFYDKYKGPQALHIKPGAHTTQETTSLFGLPNTYWSRAKAWMDHYVKGEPKSEDLEFLNWETANTFRVLKAEKSSDIFNKRQLNLQLSEPMPEEQNWFDALWSDPVKTGKLSPELETNNWEYTTQGATETGVDAGGLFIPGAIQGFTGIAPSVKTKKIKRAGAGVWRGETLEQLTTVAGSGTVELSITPSSSKFTVLAYLYDEKTSGKGALITYGVQSIHNAEPGKTQQVTIKLNPMLWDVPAGNRLMLVVDSYDERFLNETKSGDVLTFSSTSETPALLTVPLN